MADNPSHISELDKLFTPLVDEAHMQAWCQKFLGFTIPDCKLTKWDTATPLSFIWETYRAIMDGKSLDIMAIAGRGGCKTVGTSVIGLLSILHDTRGFVHAGVTTEQANRARDYFDKYLKRIPELKNFMGGETNRRKVVFELPSGEASAEIISLKPERVQGPHQALFMLDEVGSIGLTGGNNEALRAYRDSAGIPVTSSKGKPAVKVRITSRHSRASVPEQEMENAPKTGLQIRKWTTISVMKKCLEERCGTRPTPLYINVYKDAHFTPEEFDKLPDVAKDGFELAPDTMDGCLKCPLLHLCQGRARFQTSESALMTSIDDVINKVQSQPHEWSLSQLLSLRPSSEALVYHEFDPQLHQPGWNAMWERLTGFAPDREITRELFIAECAKQKCMWIAGEDWGFTNPATCVVLAIDRHDNIYVLGAFGATQKDDPEWIQHIQDHILPIFPPIEAHIPDPENPSGLSLMRKAEMPVFEVDKGKGSVWLGINTVKRFLKVPGRNRYTKLFFAPDLVSTVPGRPGIIEEMGLYEKEIDPISGKPRDDENPRKGNDHYLDSLRYSLYWLFGKQQAITAWADNTPQQQSANADFREKFLQQAERVGGFTVDRSQKPDDEDKGPTGGAGGGVVFKWT